MRRPLLSPALSCDASRDPLCDPLRGHPPEASVGPGPAVEAVVPSTVAETARLRVSSASLLRGARELEIVHGEAVYLLRLTTMGKLILTK